VVLKIDTTRNAAQVLKEQVRTSEVVSDTEHPEDDHLFPQGHGTQVTIELEGRYQKGRQSVDEYLEQTAIANPHATFHYVAPTNERIEFNRSVEVLPAEPQEIKPHPLGIELGTLIQMLERTEHQHLGGFLREEFCRVGPTKSAEVIKRAGLTARTWSRHVGHAEAEALYKAIQNTRFTAPPVDCIQPIGTRTLLAGLLKEVKAEFYAASTRPAAVYRGRPFIIEAALAYGGDLPAEEPARVIRFANRVPLLYQQSGCASFKSVVEANWRNYTSESKEAIADYDEIRKEMRLALQECGRKLNAYLNRRRRMRREGERRTAFLRYIAEIARSCELITGTPAQRVEEALMEQARTKTAEFDCILDDEGRVVDDGGRLASDDGVIIREQMQQAGPGGGARDQPPDDAPAELLFNDERPRRAPVGVRRSPRRNALQRNGASRPQKAIRVRIRKK
jgi:DNA topoisomerase-6 subunit B